MLRLIWRPELFWAIFVAVLGRFLFTGSTGPPLSLCGF